VWADVDEPLPFDDAAFDVVVAAELLEHLRRPDLLMAEISRVLPRLGRSRAHCPTPTGSRTGCGLSAAGRSSRTPRTSTCSGCETSCAS
jgi:SAM-dependent methyltransferase